MPKYTQRRESEIERIPIALSFGALIYAEKLLAHAVDIEKMLFLEGKYFEDQAHYALKS